MFTAAEVDRLIDQARLVSSPCAPPTSRIKRLRMDGKSLGSSLRAAHCGKQFQRNTRVWLTLSAVGQGTCQGTVARAR